MTITQTSTQTSIAHSFPLVAVPLVGSDKQCTWATTLRRGVLAALRRLPVDNSEDTLYRLASLHTIPRAAWWIARRNVNAKDIVQQASLYPTFPPITSSSFGNAYEACSWASMIAHNRIPGIILDTETTGLTGNVEIVDIAVIDTYGHVLLNTLVRPTCPIPREATAIHGITDDMVATAPTFSELWPYLRGLLCHYPLTIYNAAYDTRVIRQLASRERYSYPPIRAYCAMLAYAAFRGIRGIYGDFQWHKLTQAATYIGADIGTAHRALGDCQTTLNLIRAMATIDMLEEDSPVG